MKTAFIMSENHDVIQDYVEHKGANFRVLNRVGEQQFDILCRQVNIEKTNYTFIPKKDLEQGLRDDLYIGLVIFIDGEKPRKYLFPSTVWNTPNQMFSDSSVKYPEYGINLNSKTMVDFVSTYAFEKVIDEV